jgi:hypothetical protein
VDDERFVQVWGALKRTVPEELMLTGPELDVTKMPVPETALRVKFALAADRMIEVVPELSKNNCPTVAAVATVDESVSPDPPKTATCPDTGTLPPTQLPVPLHRPPGTSVLQVRCVCA